MLSKKLVAMMNTKKYGGHLSRVCINTLVFMPFNELCSVSKSEKFRQQTTDFQNSRKASFTFDEPVYMRMMLGEKTYDINTNNKKNRYETIYFSIGDTYETSQVEKIHRFHETGGPTMFVIETENSYYMASDLYPTKEIMQLRKNVKEKCPDFYSLIGGRVIPIRKKDPIADFYRKFAD